MDHMLGFSGLMLGVSSSSQLRSCLASGNSDTTAGSDYSLGLVSSGRSLLISWFYFSEEPLLLSFFWLVG